MRIKGRGTKHEPYVIRRTTHSLFYSLSITRENLQRLFFFVYNYPADFLKEITQLCPEKMSNGRYRYKNINIKGGLRIISIAGMKSVNHSPVEFRLLTHEVIQAHHLKKMQPCYFKGHKDYSFAYVFLEDLLLPLMECIPKGSRGKFKDKGTSLFWLKADASELYNLFNFICKTGRYPSYFEKLLGKINTLPKEDQKLFYNREKPKPIPLTAICIEEFQKKMGGPLESIPLRSFYSRLKNKRRVERFSKKRAKKLQIEEDDSSFQAACQKGIRRHGSPDYVYKHYLRGFNPLLSYDENISDIELENLSQSPPFSYIFKLLGLI